ncbi:DciA family protein [Lysobacter fragariae]
MSEPKAPRHPSAPRAALEALLAEPSGDPIRRALWLDGLDRQLRPLLPPSFAPHVRLANFERGRLVFVVDAPVWRAKLRLAAPELLESARSIGLEASELVVKSTVSPSAGSASPIPATRKSKPMSAAARNALQSALASLQQPDPSGSDDAD